MSHFLFSELTLKPQQFRKRDIKNLLFLITLSSSNMENINFIAIIFYLRKIAPSFLFINVIFIQIFCLNKGFCYDG